MKESIYRDTKGNVASNIPIGILRATKDMHTIENNRKYRTFFTNR